MFGKSLKSGQFRIIGIETIYLIYNSTPPPLYLLNQIFRLKRTKSGKGAWNITTFPAGTYSLNIESEKNVFYRLREYWLFFFQTHE